VIARIYLPSPNSQKRRERIVSQCIGLFHAQNINAVFSTTHKALIISAQVTLNPFADHVQICRNPLQLLLPPPAVLEYMIVGTRAPGIHTDLAVQETITASFAMDATPAKVAVYSMGIDNPARVEINVGSAPLQAAQASQRTQGSSQAPQTASTGQPTSAQSGAAVEATGWSKDFILQDALANAVTSLRAQAGFRNPDVGLGFEIVQLGGQIGGFTLHTGVFVTVKSL
jgi:hypothetical protein